MVLRDDDYFRFYGGKRSFFVLDLFCPPIKRDKVLLWWILNHNNQSVISLFKGWNVMLLWNFMAIFISFWFNWIFMRRSWTFFQSKWLIKRNFTVLKKFVKKNEKYIKLTNTSPLELVSKWKWNTKLIEAGLVRLWYVIFFLRRCVLFLKYIKEIIVNK